jgi:hypothetical protein
MGGDQTSLVSKDSGELSLLLGQSPNKGARVPR